MKYENAVRLQAEDNMNDMTEPSRASIAKRISELFPNLSVLERFVLSDILVPEQVERLSVGGVLECHSHFNPSHIAKNVSRYVDYLGHKERWEARKSMEKAGRRRIRPLTLSCDRSPDLT